MSESTTKELQDISLSADSLDEANPSNKSLTRTETLKRLFKVQSKGNSLERNSAKDMKKTDSDISEPDEGNDEKPQKETQRRFQLRLNRLNSAEGSTHTADCEASTSNTSNATARPSLKTSISNYWNAVFKRHQSTKASDSSLLAADSSLVDSDGAPTKYLGTPAATISKGTSTEMLKDKEGTNDSNADLELANRFKSLNISGNEIDADNDKTNNN